MLETVHYSSLMNVSARLRSGELTSTALTEAILARIAKHDGALRSYTTLLADRALAKARQADDELARGFWRGFPHGVPIAVKDLCYTDFGQVADLFQDIDVQLIPVMKTSSLLPSEWEEMLGGDIAASLRYTAPFDLTGMPTLTLNGGFDKRGGPIGFQLVGKRLSEDLLLRAGHAFQSITDWHTRHPVLD